MTQPVPQAKPVTAAEVYAIFNSPAIIVDRFYASGAKEHVRITFAENVAGTEEKIPRCSIVVTWQALAELGQLVSSLLNQKSNPQPTQPQEPKREELN